MVCVGGGTLSHPPSFIILFLEQIKHQMKCYGLSTV